MCSPSSWYVRGVNVCGIVSVHLLNWLITTHTFPTSTIHRFSNEIPVICSVIIPQMIVTSLNIHKTTHEFVPQCLAKQYKYKSSVFILLRPILEYCTPLWSPHHIGLVDKIEKVQRRFTKIIFCLSYLSYRDRQLSLKDSLHVRRIK